jgi:hypothetical protein
MLVMTDVHDVAIGHLERRDAWWKPGMISGAETLNWSLTQLEYATDLVFRSAATLGPLYEQLTRQSVLSVKGACP